MGEMLFYSSCHYEEGVCPTRDLPASDGVQGTQSAAPHGGMTGGESFPMMGVSRPVGKRSVIIVQMLCKIGKKTGCGAMRAKSAAGNTIPCPHFYFEKFQNLI